VQRPRQRPGQRLVLCSGARITPRPLAAARLSQTSPRWRRFALVSQMQIPRQARPTCPLQRHGHPSQTHASTQLQALPAPHFGAREVAPPAVLHRWTGGHGLERSAGGTSRVGDGTTESLGLALPSAHLGAIRATTNAVTCLFDIFCQHY
jgi:hypothetical protein